MRALTSFFFRMLKRPIDILRCKSDPSAFARRLGVSVGKEVRFIGLNPNGGQFGSEPYLIEIGDHVTITANVQFVNHDGGMWVFRQQYPSLNRFGKIKIGDNCFIGYGSIIMPGVTIGSNCVIGAGSVVNKDIADNIVAAGVPARKICSTEEYFEKNRHRMEFKEFLSSEEKMQYLKNHFADA